MGGVSRCKVGFSSSLKLMGSGTMSTPIKDDPAGLDNVSYIYVILEYLYNILDGRSDGRSERTAGRFVY